MQEFGLYEKANSVPLIPSPFLKFKKFCAYKHLDVRCERVWRLRQLPHAILQSANGSLLLAGIPTCSWFKVFNDLEFQ